MPVVESNEEMKKNMQKKKREEAESHKVKTSSLNKSTGTKVNTGVKVENVKYEAPNKKEGIKANVDEKREDVSDKIEEVKEDASSKKDEINDKLGDVKDSASDTKDDLKQGLDDTVNEAEKEKKRLEKDSEKKGMTPAEKILNDIVTRFRQGSDQINDVILDSSEKSGKSKSKTSKKIVDKPLVDILENNDTVYLVADISGVKKDDIEIGISKNSVELTITFQEEPEIEDAKFTQKERSYGKTHRKILLPTEVHTKEAKAKFKNCTLTITLPKMVEDITKINIDD